MISHPDMTSPVLCALDTTDADDATGLTRELGDSVGGVKLGLEFFSACGRKGFEQVAQTGVPIFLDLKLHDIPNTVAKAVKALVPLQPFMMTVHTSGGLAMLKAAVAAADEAAEAHNVTRPMIVGVTVLTSLDGDDLKRVGVHRSTGAQVEKLADLALEARLDGVVCSPREIISLRKSCGRDFKLVVPGIRPLGSELNDQKRVMTPGEAVSAGASYLVIGRPITTAKNPATAARKIAASLKSATF